jgi:hypothetical protein
MDKIADLLKGLRNPDGSIFLSPASAEQLIKWADAMESSAEATQKLLERLQKMSVLTIPSKKNDSRG